MRERVQHLEQPGATEDLASSYAVSPTGSSAGPREWPASTSPSPRPSGNLVSPQGQSGSPRGQQSWADGGERGGGEIIGGAGDVGGGGGGGGGEGGGGEREGWGGVPGKRHVDYEIHLKNPQVKDQARRPLTNDVVGKVAAFLHLCLPSFCRHFSAVDIGCTACTRISVEDEPRPHNKYRHHSTPCRDFYLGGKQIKLLGEGACVILCADGADVEARTYGTWGLVSSSPASPRASVFCSVSQLSHACLCVG